MSDTYDLACLSCKETLWVGQRGAGSKRPWLYYGDEHQKKLNEFLAAHQGHPLRFDLSAFVLSHEEDM